MTERWLEQHGLARCNLVFDPHKVDVAHSAGVMIAVEDSPRHAADYAAAGIIPILLTLENDAQLSADIRQLPDLSAVMREIEQHRV